MYQQDDNPINHLDKSENNLDEQSTEKNSEKVIISTGGTSSLDGKMGKMGLSNPLESKAICKGVDGLHPNQIALDKFKKSTRTRRDQSRGKKRVSKGRDDYLPNLEHKESNTIKGIEENERSQSRKKTQDWKPGEKSKRPKSPKQNQHYYFSSIVRKINLESIF